MEKNLFRFLSAVMAVFLLSMLCLPAFASVNPDPTDSRGDFYDWAVNQGGSFKGGPPSGSLGGGRYSKDHYDDFVSELPATGITSAGGLIWQATVSNVDYVSFRDSGLTYGVDCSEFNSSDCSVSYFKSSRYSFSITSC